MPRTLQKTRLKTMVKKRDKNKFGSMIFSGIAEAGIIVLVIVLMFSFVGLVYGLINIYLNAKERGEKAITVAELKIEEGDFEQKMRMDALENSLNTSMKESKELSRDIKKLKSQIKNIQKESGDKTNQINFLIAERTRLEASIKRRVAAYDAEIQGLNAEKQNLVVSLEQERLNNKKTELTLNYEISLLKKNLEDMRIEKDLAEESLSDVRKSKLVKETARMHYNLANHFLKSKNHELAIKEYKRALELCPDDADAHYNLALAYDIYTEESVAAMEHYRRYLEINPVCKNKKEIQERIVSLSLQEAVKIVPTLATRKVSHKLMLNTLNPPANR